MPEQGAFAATAAAHDDEDVAMLDSEIQIPLNHEIAVSHGQIFYCDMRRIHGLSCHQSNTEPITD